MADTLYNSIINNTSLLTQISNIKTRGKLEPSDLPGLVLSILTIYNQDKTITLSSDDVIILIERVYNALVDKYSLIDETNRADCLTLFDLSLKLAITVPIIREDGARCWSKFTTCCKGNPGSP
jgi:hypothetical protein